MSKTYLFSTSSHPNAISINSLDIKLLNPKIDFSNYDYFIITSKQVSNALKAYKTQAYIDKKALCISQMTAQSYEKLGGSVLAIGEGYGDTLVDKIVAYPKSTKWLYLRAKVIASDFVTVCRSKGFEIDETVVYESQCSTDMLSVKIDKNAALIFTSPSSVRCFLNSHEIYSSNSVIVIGKTTAKALPKGIEYRISKDKTIESCFSLIT